MIVIRGIHSNIAKSLLSIIFDDYVEMGRDELPRLDAERYFFCQGLLHGKRRVDQTEAEINNTYNVNYAYICKMCNIILEHNTNARICVMGSDSGITGSYDEVYADSKKLLHHYVETKILKRNQQLVAVAPWIISDAGMTLRRNDMDNLSNLCRRHPKGRFITSMEVAETVRHLLYVDLGFITNTVVRMNGGKHTC